MCIKAAHAKVFFSSFFRKASNSPSLFPGRDFFVNVVRFERGYAALFAFSSLLSHMLSFQIIVLWKIPQCKEAIYY